MVSATEMSVFSCNPNILATFLATFAQTEKVRLLKSLDARDLKKIRNLFVLCPATELPKVAQVASAANRLHRLRALFVEQDVEASLLPVMLHRAHLRTTRNLVVHSGSELPRRVLRAYQMGAQEQLIAHAHVLPDMLFVLTCALQWLEMPFGAMATLADLTDAERKDFTIAEDGSYIHWPHADVHLDIDAIRYITDPKSRAKADRQALLHNEQFGAAVAAVRRQHSLAQSEITGVSERQVRRIEAGSLPRSTTLTLMAKAHRMSLDTYLAQIAEKMARLGETDSPTKVSITLVRESAQSENRR